MGENWSTTRSFIQSARKSRAGSPASFNELARHRAERLAFEPARPPCAQRLPFSRNHGGSTLHRPFLSGCLSTPLGNRLHAISNSDPDQPESGRPCFGRASPGAHGTKYKRVTGLSCPSRAAALELSPL